jgi:hypothetical protein
MLPSWVDPHISLDGIAAIVTLLIAGGGALVKVLKRFTSIENQSKANAATLQEHGLKLDTVGQVLIRMEKSDGRMNLLETVQTLSNQRLDRLTDLVMDALAGKAPRIEQK